MRILDGPTVKVETTAIQPLPGYAVEQAGWQAVANWATKVMKSSPRSPSTQSRLKAP
ncbi:hypothetical protein FBZ97_108170 [Rhizobium sp. ERR 942]|nr:hypothetical protein FBZ97_108170 [Rhizobium sp. ERR 942]